MYNVFGWCVLNAFLIVKELEIIKPDFLVFLTGTTRDFIIDDIFNKPKRKEVAGFSQDDICEIKIPIKIVDADIIVIIIEASSGCVSHIRPFPAGLN
jgi:hypothetical protein